MGHLNQRLETIVHSTQTYIRTTRKKYFFTSTVINTLKKQIFEIVPENFNMYRINI
jgi:hypothetical protein